MPDGKKWRAYSPLARRRFLCGNAGLHAIVLHCQRSIARQRPVGGQSSRSWVTRIAGMAWRSSSSKTQRRNPARRLASRRLKGSSSSKCLGARQQGAQQAHPRPLPAGERGRTRAGRSPASPARLSASSTAVFRASPRTFSGSASCKFCPTLKWSNSNGS
ncbi:Uncharacterised protein [Klebsiella pneumoniae]|uniref:Uncharacterized protein n=1 Tax=Klebsiella pneumoniae TaxID=573 RepID=A0A377XVM4_KLEPN|nr:Uncharacterised protein [Klebsiella pneumoniae]